MLWACHDLFQKNEIRNYESSDEDYYYNEKAESDRYVSDKNADEESDVETLSAAIRLEVSLIIIYVSTRSLRACVYTAKYNTIPSDANIVPIKYYIPIFIIFELIHTK